MPPVLVFLFVLLVSQPPVQQPLCASRPADIAFRVQMIHSGFSESARSRRLQPRRAPRHPLGPRTGTKHLSWTKHKIRDIPFNGSYIDNFSDLPVDVDGDRFVDIVQIGVLRPANRLAEEPREGKGRLGLRPRLMLIGPTEFAFLVDLNNDGKALETPAAVHRRPPQRRFSRDQVQNGKWVKHVVSPRSYGHGIGAGDVNGDKRHDIITPAGWLEAPADVRAEGEWLLHPTDWAPAPARAGGPPPQGAPGAPQAPQPQAGPPARPPEFAFMHVLDINKDGRVDILTTMAHSYGVLWFEQREDGGGFAGRSTAPGPMRHPALADLNRDRQPDLIAAKRYFGRTAEDPAEREPMGIYWYQFRPGPKGTVEWIRHIVDYGGRAGGGLQMVVQDLDADGDPTSSRPEDGAVSFGEPDEIGPRTQASPARADQLEMW